MKVTGIKLQKAALIMVSAGAMFAMLGCEDRLADAPRQSAGRGKEVKISLCVGIADDIDGSICKDGSRTKVADKPGFDAHPVSAMDTKAIIVPEDPLATAKPDQLYGLEIIQYKYNSDDTAPIAIMQPGDVGIGSSFTGTLSDNNGDYCQLLIIARGTGNTVGSLSGKTLSAVRGITASSSSIEGITSSAYEANKSVINAMPYLLFLPKVKVVKDGDIYKIQSPEDTDIRILLRRLATRLTIAWENLPSVTGYDLKQVLLQSVPVEYKLLPPGGSETYPSLQDQYTTISISDKQAIENAGSYTCWMPAVVRGDSPKATSMYYRTKANAPDGSVYVSFISRKASDKPEDSMRKLNYRVYLGGASSYNFDIKENTNYIYKVTMSHSELPVDDRRVTIIDPIPASRNNANLVPTANCFMVVPGGAFCFDPYMYRQNGNDIENTLLENWAGDAGITSVKLLWQTLENGDLGDPVIGIVNTDDDHSNIVEIKNTLNPAEGSPFTRANGARIYCRVAPGTQGGSGVIAACDADGTPLWSWHIWVTDYSPSAIADFSVDSNDKRIQKYTYGNKTQYPMMDRNLRAKAGYTIVPPSPLERSKTNGFHFQRGRKDPFPSTYLETDKNSLPVYGDKLTPGMLNLYKPDGISFFIRGTSSGTFTLRQAFQRPTVIPSSTSDNWCSTASDQSWNDLDGNKTWNDPCPAGWRVASKVHYQALFSNVSYTESSGVENMNLANSSTLEANAGAVLYFEEQGSGHSTYVRFTGYQQYSNSFNFVGYMANLWCREANASDNNHGYAFSFILKGKVNYASNGTRNISSNWASRDAHPLRCIQDR